MNLTSWFNALCVSRWEVEGVGGGGRGGEGGGIIVTDLMFQMKVRYI